MAPAPSGVQSPPAEVRFREELEFLARFDAGDRPPGVLPTETTAAFLT
jgi:hypothetical protein